MKVRVCSLALLLVGTPALAKRLDVASSDASSTYPDEGNIAYDAGRASDGKLSTAWVEGKEGSGLGEWLELDLGGEKRVHKLKVWGGMWYSPDYWRRSNRPSELELKFSDGSTQVLALADEMVPAELVLASPKATTSVRLRIKSVYPGTTWLDTAISEVQVFDAEASDGAVVREVTASSVMPADADGSYEPLSVADGLVDSMWCEGTEGDGAGEWLEFRFDGTPRIGRLALVNGNGSALTWWMKGNRASGATLKFSDGSSEDIVIKNTMMPQEITFSPRAAASVRLTFTGVVKGKEYNDLCVSEASFK